MSIVIENLCKKFGTTPVLQNFSWTVDRPMVLMGRSGCGKTTLLRCIGGFEKPTSGEILYKGQNIISLPPYKRAINTVFQRYALFPHLNVAQNVAFGPDLRKEDKKKTAEEVSRMLALVGLAGFEKRRISSLSGGQQQRVAIARALINKPKILLADEPTGNLDANNAWEIMKLMEEINEQGTTVVVVTHNLEIVKAMNKRVITMQKGVVVDDTASDHYGKDTSVEQDDDLFDDFLDDGGDDDYAD